MKAIVGAFDQEKALVIVKPVVEPMDRFTALVEMQRVAAISSVTRFVSDSSSA